MAIFSLPLIGRRKKAGSKPRFSINIRFSFPKIGKKGKKGAGGGAKG